MSGQLKRKICKSAYLLSPVSPSRLTEELLKIINSGHAYDIVRFAMDVDIYMYLQPAATALMYADRKFERNYFMRLKELDSLHIANPDVRLGQKLVYLIYDFAAELTDWKKEVSGKSAAGSVHGHNAGISFCP